MAETIPGPLLDRMEVIRFDGYTTDEKVAIARGYLWPRQVERNGLREDEVSISDGALDLVVTEYTREAGVRQLERELGTVLRKTAKIASDAVETPSSSTRTPSARRSVGASFTARSPSGQPSRASQRVWPPPRPAATSSSSRRRPTRTATSSSSPVSSAT